MGKEGRTCKEGVSLVVKTLYLVIKSRVKLIILVPECVREMSIHRISRSRLGRVGKHSYISTCDDRIL